MGGRFIGGEWVGGGGQADGTTAGLLGAERGPASFAVAAVAHCQAVLPPEPGR